MRGRILAVADATAAGLIAGDDGHRYRYGLIDLRCPAPRAGDGVDFRVEAAAGPGDASSGDTAWAREIYAALDARPVAGALAPTVPSIAPPTPARPDWAGFYFNPNGRVAMGDYWLYGFLVLFAVNVFVGWIPIFGQVVSLVAAWAGIALAIKRCHDVNRSGWWGWLPMLPLLAALAAIPLALAEAHAAAIVVGAVGGIACLGAAIWVFFAILIRSGDPATNRFGPPPTPIKP